MDVEMKSKNYTYFQKEVILAKTVRLMIRLLIIGKKF